MFSTKASYLTDIAFIARTRALGSEEGHCVTRHVNIRSGCARVSLSSRPSLWVVFLLRLLLLMTHEELCRNQRWSAVRGRKGGGRQLLIYDPNRGLKLGTPLTRENTAKVLFYSPVAGAQPASITSSASSSSPHALPRERPRPLPLHRWISCVDRRRAARSAA